jgi:hypothetical protein
MVGNEAPRAAADFRVDGAIVRRVFVGKSEAIWESWLFDEGTLVFSSLAPAYGRTVLMRSRMLNVESSSNKKPFHARSMGGRTHGRPIAAL